MHRHRKLKPVSFSKVFKLFLKKIEEQSGKSGTTRSFQSLLRQLLHGAIDLLKGEADHIRLLRNIDICFRISMEFGEAVVEDASLKATKKATDYQKLMANALDPRFGGVDLVIDHPQGQKKIHKYENRIARLRSLAREFAENSSLEPEEFWSGLENEAEKVVRGV